MSDQNVNVPGFLANGVSAGIKDNGKKDLALLYSVVPAQAVGVFTTNRFKAAPVILDMERIQRGLAQAIVINSGNANASTGERGYDDAVAMSRAIADGLAISEDLVLVASTGVIGEKLPVKKIVGRAGDLIGGLSADGIPVAEESIMTTDKFPKIAWRKCVIGGKEVTVCGIAKGAGMIEPKMATMLSFIMTDASIDYHYLGRVFKKAIDASFHAITVDGCMSTNDTVIMLANGVAGNGTLTGRSPGAAVFRDAVTHVMTDLAREIVRDGEGATKIIHIIVEEVRSRKDGRKIAYAIANSNLVKTAFYGGDPNWGRIIAAVGSSGVAVEPGFVSLFMDGIPLFKDGTGVRGGKEQLAHVMKKDSIEVLVKLGMGKKSYHLFASDLTHEYVTINAHYHT
jgi:glutamate N-acetyltransferase/amino-acid N-acetyltransferase